MNMSSYSTAGKELLGYNTPVWPSYVEYSYLSTNATTFLSESTSYFVISHPDPHPFHASFIEHPAITPHLLKPSLSQHYNSVKIVINNTSATMSSNQTSTDANTSKPAAQIFQSTSSSTSSATQSSVPATPALSRNQYAKQGWGSRHNFMYSYNLKPCMIL